MRRDRITIYRTDAGVNSEWRWQWQARNGRIVGASTEGYVAKRDCIANLERITSGVVVISWTHRGYQQGELLRPGGERLFLAVLP